MNRDANPPLPAARWLSGVAIVFDTTPQKTTSTHEKQNAKYDCDDDGHTISLPCLQLSNYAIDAHQAS